MPRSNLLVVITTCAFSTTLFGCHWGLAGVIAMSGTQPAPYRAESIADEIGPVSARTLGCLDIGFVVYERDNNEMVDLHLGNRCLNPEVLDMRMLVIRGSSQEGLRRELALRDPRSEIVSLSVGGAERGLERFYLDGAAGLDRVCFDVERIAPDAPESRSKPVCFERRGTWAASSATGVDDPTTTPRAAKSSGAT